MCRGFSWGEFMNEKFFDLKKEKQDRMINAALKIFALNGYAHASTDDIVKEAGISKGLLFHYFTNKIGLYSFIYDFSIKFVTLELTGTVDITDNDYFGLYIQIKNTESSVMRSYPYMIDFLNSTEDEDVLEALNEIASKKNTIPEKIEEYFKHANTYSFAPDTNIKKLSEIIEYTSRVVMKNTLKFNPDHPEFYARDMKDYLITLKKGFYR